MISFADSCEGRTGNSELRCDFAQRPLADPFIKLKACDPHTEYLNSITNDIALQIH